MGLRSEGDSLKVVDCLGEVALAALIVAAHWECTAGAQVTHLLDPLQNRLGQLLVFRLHYLGHKNSALSLFVGTESDPRGHGLSHLKPGVNIGELFGVSGDSYYSLINGPDSRQICGTFWGTVDPKWATPTHTAYSASGRHFDPIIFQEPLLKMFKHTL
jgi:hypothetical protein